MQKIIITGGPRLIGEVEVSGAKNAALPILAATLLAPGPCRIDNVPDLMDVKTLCKLLEFMGMKTRRDGRAITMDAATILNKEAPYELVKTMRASVLVLCPLVARFGEAKVSLPGGCAIGARPINLHLMGLEKMGAKVQIEHGYVYVTADRLKGARIYFDIKTVTGTENLMMAGALAEGTTVLENAACEPEVVDLADFLNKMGANIKGAGTDTITIEGVSELTPSDYSVMPDRIEAATFIAAAAITRGDVLIKNCIPAHLDAVISKLQEVGVDINKEADGLRVKVMNKLKSVDVKTMPYPGFPTDMQAQMMALMCTTQGLSVITETIFENRFTHVMELQRMGADIRIEGNSAMVTGIGRLSGAPVMATDLRASASLILAGLAAKDETEISRIYHLDRGYERIEDKLSRLGAKIKRVS
ncbi:MAG: UDP-N-acetylglucosamine 1-carboxyvinyltransferase [Nitrospirota bacterium]|nr:UDP-N-acetylglucosamine 1-carboxyvinyltransferase [Nitrospirota bacterium]